MNSGVVTKSYAKIADNFRDIQIGPTNEMWAIGKIDSKPYYYKAETWRQEGELSAKIAVGPKNTWILNNAKKIM